MSSVYMITILLFTTLFNTLHLPKPMLSMPVHPEAVQTQILYPTRPATIPAFPEQSQASACPLELPENLFHDIRSACVPKIHHKRPDPDFYSDRLHRSRCCPVLAAWAYSAYSKTGLRVTETAKAPFQTAPYDLPVLPDDPETCVDTLEEALGNRGVQLVRPNETCDVFYCYCGIKLHPFSCPEAFRVNTSGKLVGGESVKKLERDCFGHGGGLGVCSKCLRSLYLLNGDRSNKTDRTSKLNNMECEIMGLTWLLNKNRSAYIHIVSAVLRAIMMNTGDSDPASCTLNGVDGMPLGVDSSEINNHSSSSWSSISVLRRRLLPLTLFCTSTLFLVQSLLVSNPL